MKVKHRMIKKLITIKPDATIPQAIEIMKKHSIRHLPVVAEKSFVGFVTAGDLRQAFYPSMINKLSIKDIMIKKPITVDPEASLEEATGLIFRHRIGGLPVLDNGKLVGIITTTDILEAFMQLMGVLKSSSRIDVILGEKPDALEQVSRIIKENKGEIISMGTSSHARKGRRIYYFRLEKCNTHRIAKALEEKGYKVTMVIE
jgi:acetoin utilization protein AcuB